MRSDILRNARNPGTWWKREVLRRIFALGKCYNNGSAVDEWLDVTYIVPIIAHMFKISFLVHEISLGKEKTSTFVYQAADSEGCETVVYGYSLQPTYDPLPESDDFIHLVLDECHFYAGISKQWLG